MRVGAQWGMTPTPPGLKGRSAAGHAACSHGTDHSAGGMEGEHSPRSREGLPCTQLHYQEAVSSCPSQGLAEPVCSTADGESPGPYI